MKEKIRWSAKWIWPQGKTQWPFHIAYFRKEFDLPEAVDAASLFWEPRPIR